MSKQTGKKKRVRTTVTEDATKPAPEVKPTTETVDFYVEKSALPLGLAYTSARYPNMSAKDAKTLNLKGYGLYWKDFCEREGIDPNETQ